MKTYISFLRGINMTGHNIIQMADLKVLYQMLGFEDVETYIQSGNVIFRSSKNIEKSDISLMIEEAITLKYNYRVPVMIKTVAELHSLLSVNPFLNEESFDPAKMAVIFVREELSRQRIEKVSNLDYPPDKFRIVGNEIFIWCPNGFGRSKIYTGFFEKKMGINGTGRNWKTITTLLDIAGRR
jgi:uncharacterized protein (DUF1697 family)